MAINVKDICKENKRLKILVDQLHLDIQTLEREIKDGNIIEEKITTNINPNDYPNITHEEIIRPCIVTDEVLSALNEVLFEHIANMKCCGNCNLRHCFDKQTQKLKNCKKFEDMGQLPHLVCSTWEHDELTYNQRSNQ